MNIDNLTDKQKANRAYYAANAERIREKKRQQYYLKIAKQKKEFDRPIKCNTTSLNSRRPIKIKKAKEQSTRSKIEDYQTLREIDQWF